MTNRAKDWLTWVAAIVIGTLIGVLLNVGIAAATNEGQVCEGAPKVDVSGSHKSITVTAPDGYLITGYCVKAGSAKQGLGPEYVDVDPDAVTVTITHSSGKDISHYVVYLTEMETPPSTTQPPPPTTIPPTTVPPTTVPTTVPPTTTPSTSTSTVVVTSAPTTAPTTVVEVSSAIEERPAVLAYTGSKTKLLVTLGILLTFAGVLLTVIEHDYRKRKAL